MKIALIVSCCVFAHDICAASPPIDGSVLPFPPIPSASVTAPRLQDSKLAPRPAVNHVSTDAPNTLIILMDDVGFGLADTYRGPIHTPTLSRIANNGVNYNAFHTTGSVRRRAPFVDRGATTTASDPARSLSARSIGKGIPA
jgi:arylsulfatase